MVLINVIQTVVILLILMNTYIKITAIDTTETHIYLMYMIHLYFVNFDTMISRIFSTYSGENRGVYNNIPVNINTLSLINSMSEISLTKKKAIIPTTSEKISVRIR